MQLPEKELSLKEAAIYVVVQQKCSVSFLQQRLKLGYNRASLIIDQLEKKHIVAPFTFGNSYREVLVKNLEDLNKIIEL